MVLYISSSFPCGRKFLASFPLVSDWSFGLQVDSQRRLMLLADVAAAVPRRPVVARHRVAQGSPEGKPPRGRQPTGPVSVVVPAW